MFDGTWSGSGKYIRGIPVGDDVIRHRFTRLYKSDRPYARRLRAVQARIAARRLPPRVYDWSRRGPGGRRQRIVVRPVVNDDSLALVPMTEAEIAASHDAWMREAYPYRYPVEQAMERGVARVGELIGEGSEAVGRIVGSVRGAVDRGVSAALSVFGRGGTFAEAQAAGEHAMVSGAADQSPGVLNSMQAALGAVVAAAAQKGYETHLGAAARQRLINRVADAAAGAVATTVASRGTLGAALSGAASAVTGAATSAVLQGVESSYGGAMDETAHDLIRSAGVQLGGREATPEDLAVFAGGVRAAGQLYDSIVRTPARQPGRVGDVSSAVTVYSPDALRGGGGDTVQSALLDAATGGVTHLIGVGHDGDVADLGAGGRLRPIDPNTPMRGQGRYRRVRWRR